MPGTNNSVNINGEGLQVFDPSTGVFTPIDLTTKGDLLTYSTTYARLGVGNDGEVLTADSTQTTGLKWSPVSGDPPSVFSRLVEFDDFLGNAEESVDNTKLGWAISSSGNANTYSEAGHPGIWGHGLGGAGTQHCWMCGDGGATKGCLQLGGGILNVYWVMKLVSLSNGTNTFQCRAGICFPNPASSTEQIWFSYTHSVNSGNWVINSMASSVTTSANTSTAATTDWTVLQIQVNAAASSIAYLIDGVEVANSPIATNIPTGQRLKPFITLQKTAGAGSNQIYFDLMVIDYQLTTSRI